MIYGGTRVATELMGLAKQIRSTPIPDSEYLEMARQVSAKALKSTGALDNAFLLGWDETKVLAMKPRPAVSSYLNPVFEQSHLAKFQGKASYLVTGDAYNQFIAPFNSVGRADGLFISTVNDIDAVLQKASGNISIIETELGIKLGSWQGKGGIYRIDITNPENYNLRLPSGNESGANEFWIPGGYLPDGKVEAITNPIPKSNIIVTKVIN